MRGKKKILTFFFGGELHNSYPPRPPKWMMQEAAPAIRQTQLNRAVWDLAK